MSDTQNGNGQALARRDASLMARDEKGVSIDAIKRLILPSGTDDELALFARVCNQTGLSPFTKQIYAIKRNNRATNQQEMAIQFGIDGLRLIAERTGKYAGSETHWCDTAGEWTDIWTDTTTPPFAARTTVWKVGSDHPTTAVARWASYAQYTPTRSGERELSRFWKSMPDVMLAKCSEGLALRKAFPQELAGYVQAAPDADRAGDRIINRTTGEIEDEDAAFDRLAAEYAAEQERQKGSVDGEFRETTREPAGPAVEATTVAAQVGATQPEPEHTAESFASGQDRLNGVEASTPAKDAQLQALWGDHAALLDEAEKLGIDTANYRPARDVDADALADMTGALRRHANAKRAAKPAGRS